MPIHSPRPVLRRSFLKFSTWLRREERRRAAAHAAEPLKARILTAPQMAAHGRKLARQHRLASHQRLDTLLARLSDNERTLQKVNAALVATVAAEKPITPAGEWLLDNFHLIEEEIRLARRLMPLGYSRALPQLEGSPHDGLPRVYELVLHVISHGDSRIALPTLSGFIEAYQGVAPLRIGELWAIPIMLRLALIENLRRIGAAIAEANADRRLANRWAEAMLDAVRKQPADVILLVADMARSDPPMSSAFVAEFVRRLQANPALGLPLSWVAQHLAASGLTIDGLVQAEIADQAAAQLTVSNGITSLRVLDSIDWREFVETLSVVEVELRADPSGVYPRMDFATRDACRHVVEGLARLAPYPKEQEVARAAFALAQAASGDNAHTIDECHRHVGYYLLDAGRPQLEQVLGVRRPWWRRLRPAAATRAPLGAYLGAIALLSAGAGFALFTLGAFAGLPLFGQLAMGALCVLAASQPALGVVNWAATLFVAPRLLPRMDFQAGVPQSRRTLVVIPALLDSAVGLESLVDALEIHFLGNRDPALFFALATDFRDATAESLPEDAALLEMARDRITALNRRHAPGDAGIEQDIFFLLHRPRTWNPQEGAWMGHERKRGKLIDLTALLRGKPGAAARFSSIVGNADLLRNVRYVITLDADTRLPPGAAREMIAAMSHPLNRPRFAARHGEDAPVVIDGYGILQPRVEATLSGAAVSRHATLLSGTTGVDPYSQAASDVYQDLFSEGSFIGKGIFDAVALEQVMAERLPENRILSHDLLEGCFARSGLLSDVTLYEDYPATYATDVARRHRWTRGDWQLLPWILPWLVKHDRATGSMRRRPNPLSALSRWKLLDNLRRSLAPVALVALLGAVWWWSPQPGVATLALALIVLSPALVAWGRALLGKPAEARWRLHLAAQGSLIRRGLLEQALRLASLPHEAHWRLDAILRSLWRVTVSKRRLLEWTPSSDVDGRRTAAFQRTWAAPLVAVVAAVPLVLAGRHEAWLAAAPWLLLWLGLPVLVRYLDAPPRQQTAPLEPGQTDYLRTVARRTWGYFEHFVTARDHWLPPDNHQEYPVARTAHRTSPTNMGMALLANVAAWDFGYITGGALLERSERTLDTMERLPRYRGHFFNWYDTESLEPLRPAYVSSVDSGNLAGFLLTMGGALEEIAQAPVLGPQWIAGIEDTRRTLTDVDDDATLAAFDVALAAARDNPAETLSTLWDQVTQLARAARGLLPVAQARDAAGPPAPPVATGDAIAPGDPAVAGPEDHPQGGEPDVDARDDSRYWRAALARQVLACEADLLYLMPALGTDPVAADGPIPTLQQLAAREGDAEIARTVRVRARRRLARIRRLITHARALSHMDYEFLYDESRKLMVIGYNVDEQQRDAACYDLLASEARLGQFVVIAQGQLPRESWFALGRRLATASGQPVLASWSGSMFEYLMPLLVMPSYRGSLLDRSCATAVARHIEYGHQRGIPWGISESGYHAFDASLNYQYRAFGVPGLGLKRGLGADLVVAPYATLLAAMVAPQRAIANLKRLEREGAAGRFGFHEAIDYTAERLPRGARSMVVRSFMAHHQGMGLLSLLHVLLDQPMQRRFASATVRAALLLLQERMPATRTDEPLPETEPDLRPAGQITSDPARVIETVDNAQPEVQLLSNGRYHVMITDAGGGYSRWQDLAVTRWEEDGTRDHWGSFCYVRDRHSGRYWSVAYQPTGVAPRRAQAILCEGRVEFRRRDAVDATDPGLDTHTEIVVSPEDDIELRRVRITNLSRKPREIDVTSYVEVVLAPPADDASHPAFRKLFVQTELLESPAAILCTRRPRSSADPTTWLFHSIAARDARGATISWETDRAAFVGRGETLASPAAMRRQGPLGGTTGSVLDPVAAARAELVLGPGEAVTIDITTGVAGTRDECIALAARYEDRFFADRVIELAWTHGQAVLRQLNASEGDAQLYARLAGAILYAHSRLRADSAVLQANRRGQSGLWGHAISGDLPIVLVRISALANLDLVRQVLQAHEWWRQKGLAVDLVIWNEDHDVYRQQLHEQILALVNASAAHHVERPGGVFVRHIEHIPAEDQVLVQSVARVILSDRKGSLADQVQQAFAPDLPGRAPLPPRLAAAGVRSPAPAAAAGGAGIEVAALQEYNGYGGFSADGREYVIAPEDGRPTPAPWCNVLANPRFGSIVSDSGSAYTWSENAHGLRLTPWHNDPVIDDGGEAFYLRDDHTGHAWSPARGPLSTPTGTRPVVRHGFGYSVFEHHEDGIDSELTMFVAIDAPIKFSRLRIRNRSGRPRRLSAFGYVEWVLGTLRAASGTHLITAIDPESHAILARNHYHPDFPGTVAFFDNAEPQRTVTGDREEFIGRLRSLRDPAALERTVLSNWVGAALDPCAAIHVGLELEDGEEREIVFRLGAGRDLAEARELLRRYATPAAVDEAAEAVDHYWRQTLGTVQVRTPEPSLDRLVNGWLPYQTLACRYWARSGYYQSSGAWGFRDQLQDAMALVHLEPGVLREHLLRSASRQFIEGDVQHWWHPPSGRGVRTRCSDDYLWLPLAICRYVAVTGDDGVLDEAVPFLTGPPVAPGEESYFDLPTVSGESAPLYQHGVRAIEHGLRFGAHGLPLIGGGDWNDGMNLVGLEGRGESVWLGFFLCEILRQFAALAQERGDATFAQRCRHERAQLARNLEEHGWDGDWWRRAYFDDGSPLGSATNTECRIDSISQSWSVLSGVADPERARRAMDALDTRLVRREDRIVQLLEPPFDVAEPDPGYIRGYVPGVRENGGQYTHAAVWAAMAFAALGDGERAWELWHIIEPAGHARSPEGAARYKVEPYVLSADIYSVPPHVGRGGWSWYTGSAGWLLRFALESLLGLRRAGRWLRLEPCLPADWHSFALTYRHGGTTWHITVVQHDDPGHGPSLTVDGVAQPEAQIEMIDDGQGHQVHLSVPRSGGRTRAAALPAAEEGDAG